MRILCLLGMQIDAQIRLNTVRGKLNIRDMKIGAKVESVVVILFKISLKIQTDQTILF